VQAARTLPERRARALLELAGEALTHGLDTDPPASSGTGEDTGTPGLFNDHDDTADTTADDTTADDTTTADTTTTDTTTTDDSTTTGDDSDAGPADGDGDGDRDGEDGSVGGDADAAPGAPGGPPAWTRADLEGGERPALTVTLNYDTLRAALGEHAATGPTRGLPLRLALLGENTFIRPETARRMACDAEIIPALLGTRGEVLDIGRKTRTIPQALRRATILRDRHCAHPGCRRRARRCQVHHIVHWADDGETRLENCVLLCGYHHHLIHHSGWEVHMSDGLPWFTPPAWLDPLRRPRHNRPWQHQQTA
jgi:hypothetical protein